MFVADSFKDKVSKELIASPATNNEAQLVRNVQLVLLRTAIQDFLALSDHPIVTTFEDDLEGEAWAAHFIGAEPVKLQLVQYRIPHLDARTGHRHFSRLSEDVI